MASAPQKWSTLSSCSKLPAPKAKKAGGWGPLESCKVLSGLVAALGSLCLRLRASQKMSCPSQRPSKVVNSI